MGFAGSQHALPEQQAPVPQHEAGTGAAGIERSNEFGAGQAHARPSAGNEPIAVATASSTHASDRNEPGLIMASYTVERATVKRQVPLARRTNSEAGRNNFSCGADYSAPAGGT